MLPTGGKLNSVFRAVLCTGMILVAVTASCVASSIAIGAEQTETVPFRAETHWVEELGARTRLLLADTAHDRRPFLAGVEMELAPGWHTYWRKPGDSGTAAVFGWSKSDNIEYAHVRWPAPARFYKPGDVTYGYDNHVVWPVLVAPREAGKPVMLHLSLFYAACADICVPHEAELELNIPAAKKTEDGFAAAPETDHADAIRAALARVPVTPKNPGLVKAALKGEGAIRQLDVKLAEKTSKPPMLVVEGPYYAWFGVPAVSNEADGVRYAVPVKVDPGKSLKGETLTLTLSRGDKGGYETEYTIPGSKAAAEPKPGAEAGH